MSTFVPLASMFPKPFSLSDLNLPPEIQIQHQNRPLSGFPHQESAVCAVFCSVQDCHNVHYLPKRTCLSCFQFIENLLLVLCPSCFNDRKDKVFCDVQICSLTKWILSLLVLTVLQIWRRECHKRKSHL